MNTVKLISDLNGIKAGTEMAYDEKTDTYIALVKNEDISDGVEYTTTTKVQVPADSLVDFPHLFEVISEDADIEDKGQEIYERYSRLIDDLFNALEAELKEL